MAMLASGTELGGYRIEGLLGRGGMGVVYEAVQLSLGRTVALKVLAADVSEDETFRARFRREGRLQAALDHAHIVPIYEAGDLGEDGLFIAMRLIRGATLKELIRIRGLDPARTLKIVTPVADALDTAHEAELVHRDIKPQNILVGRRDHSYLADFGLTRAPSDTAFTKTGSFVGTLDYIAPEQIRGDAATAASDIYSLAAAAFECLTGRVVFPKPNEASVLYAHMAEDPPRASAITPELPAQVDDVFARALAKMPSDRHATALEFAIDLEQALRRATPAPPSAPADRPAASATEDRTSEPATPQTETPVPDGEPTDGVGGLLPDGEREVRESTEGGVRPALSGEREVGESTEGLSHPGRDGGRGIGEDTEGGVRPGPDGGREIGESTELHARTPAPSAPPPRADAPTGSNADALGPEPPSRTGAAEPGASVPPAGEETRDHVAAGATRADRRRPWHPPSTAPVADQAAIGSRRSPRRSRAAATAVVALVAAALATGAGASLGGGGDATPSAPEATPIPPRELSADGLTVRYPARWRPAGDVPAVPGLALQGAAALEPVGDRSPGAIVIGRSGGEGPTLLPESFTKRVAGTPKPSQSVRLAGADAYRYDDLSVEGLSTPVTLFVAPLSDDVATVACLGAAADCPGVAASLEPGSGRRPVTLGPRREYARPVGSAIKRLRERRTAATRRLRAARTAKAQAAAASQLRDAHADFARRLQRIRATPLERRAHPAVVRAARRAAGAYAALAKAAARDRRSAYERARRTAGGREDDLRASLRALGRLGYGTG